MRYLLALSLLFLLLAPLAASQGTVTGNFFQNTTSISDLTDMVEVEQPERGSFNTTNGTKVFDEDEGLNMPPGYIALILAFLGIVIYSVEIDPFWIAILLFLIAFSGIVYYLSLPNYLIPLVVVLILAVRHFR